MINLNEQLDNKHLLKHDWYQAWSAGTLTIDDLRIYSRQYFHIENVFSRGVSATHSNCVSISKRQMLLDNLIDEDQGNHPALWLQFAAGLGLSETEVRNTELFPETQQFIDHFLSLTRSSYASGVGALYAYERQIPEIAASKIAGLKQHYGLDDEKTLQFFNVHLHSDIAHSNVTKKLFEDLSDEEKIIAKNAANAIAQSAWDFLTGVQNKTCNHLN